jgi:hypothetical protein
MFPVCMPVSQDVSPFLNSHSSNKINKTKARQLGLTPDDMKQVDSMWKNMDDLAESDPETYKKFTSDILAEGPPKKDTKAKSFIPTTSFVVKVTTSTNDVMFIVSLFSS